MIGSFSRRPLRTLMLACATMLAAGPAVADPVDITYSIRLIGLPLGTATVKGAVARTSYSLDAQARLTGIGAMVSNSRGSAHAEGLIQGTRVAPTAYATSSAGGQSTRTVRMAMNAGTVRGIDIAPPIPDVPGRVPVSDADKRNIVDPVSAFVMPVAGDGALVGPAACNRTLPVFDGYTRFDIPLTYTGTRDVQASGYSGPVTICQARYVPVAGHRPDRDTTKFMQNNRELEVWLAPIQSARVVIPFRISAATMIGTTVIEASDFHVGTPGQRASR